MHCFINFGSEIFRDALSQDIIEYMQVQMHFWEIPVLVFEVGTHARFLVLLKRPSFIQDK